MTMPTYPHPGFSMERLLHRTGHNNAQMNVPHFSGMIAAAVDLIDVSELLRGVLWELAALLMRTSSGCSL